MSDRDDDDLVESAKEWLAGLGQSSESDQDLDETLEDMEEADEVSSGDMDHPEDQASGDSDDADDALEYLRRGEVSSGDLDHPGGQASGDSDDADDALGYSYRSASGLAKVLQVAFVVWMVLGGIAVASSLVDYRLILRLIDDPLSVSFAQVETSGDRQSIIAVVQLVGLLVVGAIFIVWVRRLYRNLPALGVNQRFKPGWAVGAWFVPFLNLWRPKQIVDEIWKASSATRSAEVSPLLHWWWGLWIAGGVLGQIVFRDRNVSSLDDARNLALGIAASDVAELVTAGLAFWVVTRVTQRQVAHAERMLQQQGIVEAALPSSTELEYEQSATPKLGWLGVLSLPAVGVAVAVVAFLAWDVTDSGDSGGDQQSASNADARGVLANDLQVGDCFNDPGDTTTQTGPEPILAVPVVPCELPHFAEVYAVLEHPGSQSDPFPGDFAIAQQAISQCLAEFQGFVGESYDVSPLDVIFMNPDETLWRTGNRRMRCSVYRLDQQDMTGTARGSGITAAPTPTTADEGEDTTTTTATTSAPCPVESPETPPTVLLEGFDSGTSIGLASAVTFGSSTAVLNSRSSGLFYECGLFPSEGTIEVALKLDQVSGTILDSRGDRARLQGDVFLRVTASGIVEFTLAPVAGVNPTQQVQVFSKTSVFDDQCHTIAVSYGSLGIELYIDDALEDSDPFGGVRNSSMVAVGDWPDDSAIFGVVGEIDAIRTSSAQSDLTLLPPCAIGENTATTAATSAAVLNYLDFNTIQGLTLTGTATQFDFGFGIRSVLRLTPSRDFTEAGAAWYSVKQHVEDGFETTFSFEISDVGPNPGDGFAFVIQNWSRSALGEGSFGIGYHGIANSVAVEFDTTFQAYSGDVGPQHIGVHTLGTDPNNSHERNSLGRVAPDSSLADGVPHLVTVEYTPGTLMVYLDATDVPILTVPLELADTLRLDDGKAWIGFTASNEPGFRASHDILSWTFDVVQ